MSKLGFFKAISRIFYKDNSISYEDKSFKRQIDKLADEGRYAVSSARYRGFQEGLWLLTIMDLLKNNGFENSKLYSEIVSIQEKIQSLLNMSELDDEQGLESYKQREGFVLKAIYILDHIVFLVQESTTDKHDENNEHYSREIFHNNIKPTVDKWLEKDVKIKITEKYLGSGLAKIQFLVLIFLLFFTILGVIKISSYEADLNNLVEDAVIRAKESISTQSIDIESSLDDYKDEKIKSMDEKANVYFTDYKTTVLDKKLAKINREVENNNTTVQNQTETLNLLTEEVENYRIEELADAIKIVQQSPEYQSFKPAVMILNNVVGLWTIVLVLILAILSFFLLYYLRNGWIGMNGYLKAVSVGIIIGLVIAIISLGIMIFTIVNPSIINSVKQVPHDPQSDNDVVEITLLQMNDVYEMFPLGSDKRGGLARVATLRKQLLKENPNTFTILAGDLFSPSAIGTAKVCGNRLSGKQMVDVMNELGLDFATFGNHEFDLKECQFKDRLRESEFLWISSNVLNAETGDTFRDVIPYKIIEATNESGKVIKIGFIGLTLEGNKESSNDTDNINQNPDCIDIAKVDCNREDSYYMITPVIPSAKERVKELEAEGVDIIIAITHQNLKDDEKLVESVPEIDMVLGGHEHENKNTLDSPDFAPIFKADANARSVYIIQLEYDTENKDLQIEAELRPITSDIQDDPEILSVAKEWKYDAYKAFKDNGFEPDEEVVNTDILLDGQEATVRNESNCLTKLVAESMRKQVPEAQLSIYNSGSIRIDDILPAGPVSQYDVLRILPFGGDILLVKMQGRLLKQVLNQGKENSGTVDTSKQALTLNTIVITIIG